MFAFLPKFTLVAVCGGRGGGGSINVPILGSIFILAQKASASW
jgi:hypothetical protein